MHAIETASRWMFAHDHKFQSFARHISQQWLQESIVCAIDLNTHDHAPNINYCLKHLFVSFMQDWFYWSNSDLQMSLSKTHHDFYYKNSTLRRNASNVKAYSSWHRPTLRNYIKIEEESQWALPRTRRSKLFKKCQLTLKRIAKVTK